MEYDDIQQHGKTNWGSVLGGNILMMGLVSFFTDFSSEMIYPLLPIFLTGLVSVGTAAIYIGLLEGFSDAAANLLKIFSGRISDAIRKRKFLAVAGYGISTFFRPCMTLATAGWMVILFRFCDRIGKGIRTSPRDALISASVEKGVRGLAFSFHRAMDHAGAIFGPVAAILGLYILSGSGILADGGTVADAHEMITLRWLFAAALIPGLAAMAILIFKVKEIKPPGHKEGRDTAEAATKNRSLPKKFYYFLGIVTLFTMGNSSDLFLVLFGRTKFGFGLLYVLLLWVTLHISKIIFSFPGGIMSDKFGRRVMIVAGWIVYIGVYLGMAVVQRQWIFWMLILAYGAYYGLTEGAERALVADYVSTRFRGKAYGLYHGAVGIAAMPASILFGLIWVKLGPAPAFAAGAVLAAVATLLLITLLSTENILNKHPVLNRL